MCNLRVEDPTAYAEVESALEVSTREATRRAPAHIGEYAIRSHFHGIAGRTEPCDPNQTPSGAGVGSSPRPVGTTPSMELHPDGSGRITSGDIEGDAPVDWDDLIRVLGGDPATTKVKNDTIRVSARTNAAGVLIRSYGASLEPRDEELSAVQDRIRNAVAEIRAGVRGSVTPVAAKPGKKKNKHASFLIAWGDTQLGKSAGGGHETTVDRFVDCIARAVSAYEERVALGYRYDEVFMSILGDLTEGVAGNYDSQLFTVTLNATDQQTLATEVVAWAIEYVRARTGLPMRVLFVNSNHGEQSRLSMTGGGKNKTTASDTVDRLVGNMMKMVYREDKDIEILVPGGNLVMTATLSGVPMAVAHGHGIGPRAKATTIQQELVIYDEEIREANGGMPFLPRLWVTAHYHHAALTDLGPYLHVQTPALDGSSEWFTNVSGKYSRPGLFIATVGDEFVEDGGVCRPEFIWVAKAPKTKRTNWHEKLVSTYNRLHSEYSE